MIKHICTAFLLCFSIILSAQNERFLDLGVEFQAYPTGILPGAKVALAIGESSSMHLRVGLNIFDHRDLGVQEEEIGDGFGFTLGYQYYFGENYSQWFLGIRSDIWWNTVDWMNDGQSGVTDITVIQPTLVGGYAFSFADDKLIFEPALGFGFEVNVVTEGEPTGEGAIGLIGFSLNYRIKR